MRLTSPKMHSRQCLHRYALGSDYYTTFARKNTDVAAIQKTIEDLKSINPDIARRVLLPSEDLTHIVHKLMQDVCEMNALPACNAEGAPTSGIVGLVLALNVCVHVSAYGFILTNDESYYDDKHSTMWGGWQGTSQCTCTGTSMHGILQLCMPLRFAGLLSSQ